MTKAGDVLKLELTLVQCASQTRNQEFPEALNKMRVTEVRSYSDEVAGTTPRLRYSLSLRYTLTEQRRERQRESKGGNPQMFNT